MSARLFVKVGALGKTYELNDVRAQDTILGLKQRVHDMGCRAPLAQQKLCVRGAAGKWLDDDKTVQQLDDE